ncbi:MAG: DUF3307 domain-containing protein [Proteobacteria bacterium]|nr:DUF3307 domain-containing protein [Pseudomonadota bacterium]
MMLFLLLAGHALADFPLQGEFLSQAKNRHTTIGKTYWPHALAAHSMIHGGLVALITGSVALGIAEAVAHGITDWLKCEGTLNLHQDQAIHIACKFAWLGLAIAAGLIT